MRDPSLRLPRALGRARRSDIPRHRCRRGFRLPFHVKVEASSRAKVANADVIAFPIFSSSSSARTLRRIDDRDRAPPFARRRLLAPLPIRLQGFHERDEHLGLDFGLLQDGNAHAPFVTSRDPRRGAAHFGYPIHHIKFIVGSDRERVSEPVGHREHGGDRSDVQVSSSEKRWLPGPRSPHRRSRASARRPDGEIEHRPVPWRKISLAIIDGDLIRDQRILGAEVRRIAPWATRTQ